MAAKKKVTKKKTAKKKTSKKKATKKKATKKKTTRKSPASKRLTPSATQRGLDADEVVLDIEDAEVATLADQVRAAGGAAIGSYREPLSGKALLLAVLPINKVEPTPFQRDLSPTHTKRLAQKIDESGSFLDPLIVVRGADDRLWTPNGRHRLAAAKVLGLKQVTALISPDEALAFKILALNTEKAHNTKDRSLEVIRMARELAKRHKRKKEGDFEVEFEAPYLLTLGACYEKEGRFSGGAYSSFLRKVDLFSDKTLSASLREREGFASRLLAIDVEVKRIIDELKESGFKSPYLRTFVVARLNPVRFHRKKKGENKPPMALSAGLTRMAAAARTFDVGAVDESDLNLVAAVAPETDD